MLTDAPAVGRVRRCQWTFLYGRRIDAGKVPPLTDAEPAAEESARRQPSEAAGASYSSPLRGWQRLYVDHVMQADRGVDLDFLVGASGDTVTRDSH
jgi:hypothetical protein